MADPAAAAGEPLAASVRSQLSDFTILKELGRGTCESGGCILIAPPLLGSSVLGHAAHAAPLVPQSAPCSWYVAHRMASFMR